MGAPEFGGEVTSASFGANPSRRAHVLMIPFEEQGHYTVFLQLLYFLSSFDIVVTVCISERRVKHLHQLLSAGDFKSLDLRLVTLSDDVSATAQKAGALPPLWQIPKMLKLQFHAYRTTLLTETDPEKKPTCLFADVFLDWSVELAEELQIPRYLIFTAGGWFPYAALKAKIDAANQKGSEDIVKIPGLFSVPAKEIPSMIFPLVNFENLAGIVINTCEELEGEESVEAVRTMLQHMTTKPGSKVARYLPVGPMLHIPGYSSSSSNGAGQTSAGQSSKALEWLDQHPPASVLYVAFGTMANIPASLILELARGLELSGVSFLWVLRCADASVTDVSTLLPSGFLDRVKGRGNVETGWAPQLQILQHPSTGGFMSHCGWNSLMEGISAGVPILTWHMHGDQPLNARLITQVLKVGLSVRKHESTEVVVPGENVAAAAKALMIDDHGKELRKNSIRFKEMTMRTTQEGGSSCRNLQQFVNEVLSV